LSEQAAMSEIGIPAAELKKFFTWLIDVSGKNISPQILLA